MAGGLHRQSPYHALQIAWMALRMMEYANQQKSHDGKTIQVRKWQYIEYYYLLLYCQKVFSFFFFFSWLCIILCKTYVLKLTMADGAGEENKTNAYSRLGRLASVSLNACRLGFTLPQRPFKCKWRGSWAISTLDDMVVFFKTFEEHVENL